MTHETAAYEAAFPARLAESYVTSRWGQRPRDERKRLADAYRAGVKAAEDAFEEAIRAETEERTRTVQREYDRCFDAYEVALRRVTAAEERATQAEGQREVLETANLTLSGLVAQFMKADRAQRWLEQRVV